MSGSGSSLSGFAENTFYTCTTALDLGKERLSYKVEGFNNTSDVISIRASTSDAARAKYRMLGQELPLQQKVVLRKMIAEPNDAWTDNANYTVRLKLKTDGSKSIEVVDHVINKTADEENGFCKIECRNFTTWVDGKCNATGVAIESAIGNAALEYAASLGAGPLSALFKGFAKVALSKAVNLGALLGLDALVPKAAKASLRLEALNGLNPEAKKAAIAQIGRWWDEANELLKVAAPTEKPMVDSAKSISELLEEFVSDYNGEHVHLLRNSSGDIEAAVVNRVKTFKNRVCTEIVYLATAPKNLNVQANAGKRVAGLGTRAIQESVRDSAAKDCVFLFGLDAAKSFYQKLGFLEEDDFFYMMDETVQDFLKK